MVYLWGFLFFQQLAWADPFFLSQKLYEDLNNNKVACNPATQSEINKLKTCNLTAEPGFPDLDRTAEFMVFKPIADAEVKRLECQADKLAKLNASPQIKTRLLKNTCDRMKALQDNLNNQSFLKDLIESYKKAYAPGMRIIDEAEANKAMQTIAELRLRLKAYKDLEEVYRSTDSLLSSPRIYKEIKSQLEDGLIFSGKNPQQVCETLTQNLDRYLAEDLSDIRKTKEFLEKEIKTSTDWLNSEDIKRALWKSSSRKLVMGSFEEDPALKAATFCRMNGRYGIGAEHRDQLATIVEIGSGALGYGLLRAGASNIMMRLGGGAVAATRMAFVAEATVATAFGVHEAVRSCQSQIGIASSNICQKLSDEGFQDLAYKNVAVGNCALSSGLLAAQTALTAIGGKSILGAWKNNTMAKDIAERTVQSNRLAEEVRASETAVDSAAKSGSVAIAQSASTIGRETATTAGVAQETSWSLRSQGKFAEAEAAETKLKRTLENPGLTRSLPLVGWLKTKPNGRHGGSLVQLNDGVKGAFRTGIEGERELAAYNFSKVSGLVDVPITVSTTINGKKGSLQYWVEGHETYAKAAENGSRLQPRMGMDPNSLMNSKTVVFDSLIGNFDRNTGNLFVRGERSLVPKPEILFDHGEAFYRAKLLADHEVELFIRQYPDLAARLADPRNNQMFMNSVSNLSSEGQSVFLGNLNRYREQYKKVSAKIQPH